MGSLANVVPGADCAGSSPLTGNSDSNRSTDLAYDVDGEQIVGICYRKLRFPDSVGYGLRLSPQSWDWTMCGRISWRNRSTTVSPNPDTMEAMLEGTDETCTEEVRFVTFDFEDETDDEDDEIEEED